MNKYRHELFWTWVSWSGGLVRFSTEEAARSYALTYGGKGIYPPLYADD